MLNFDRATKSPMQKATNQDLLYACYIDLSTSVQVEQRKVTSILSAFGALGGLYQFLSLLMLLTISRFPAKLLAFDQVMTLFRTSHKAEIQDVSVSRPSKFPHTGGAADSIHEWHRNFKRIDLDCKLVFKLLFYGASCC